MAKTVGYNLAVGNMKKRRVAGRNSISKTKAEWLGAPKEERFTPPDVTDPRRAITRLETRVKNTKHDNDMYRIGGGPVVVVGRDNRLGKVINKQTGKREYNRGRNLRAPVVAVDRPTAGFTKGPDGKILTDRVGRAPIDRSRRPAGSTPQRRLPGYATWANTSQTRPTRSPVNRPFGKPGDAPATGIRGAGGRMGSNPAYGQWKNTALGYNSSLSRQQTLQPSNPVIQEIKPVDTNPTERYPATVTNTYRTGAEQAFVKKPQPDPSPFNSKL